MTESNPTVRGISDTARWVAYFRALETQRSDALFRDPYAERLAGAHGFQIAHSLPDGNKHEWAWGARTYLFDQFLSPAIPDGQFKRAPVGLLSLMPEPKGNFGNYALVQCMSAGQTLT